MRSRGVSTAAECYVICAVQWNFGPSAFFYFSDHAIVVVGFDQIACVHLYTLNSRQWAHGAAMSAQFLAESEKLPPDKVEKFGAASDALHKGMPETTVDNAHEGLVQHLADILRRKPPTDEELKT